MIYFTRFYHVQLFYAKLLFEPPNINRGEVLDSSVRIFPLMMHQAIIMT